MIKLLFLSFLQKILKLKEPVKRYERVTGRYCDTCGKVRNRKKVIGQPKISCVKNSAGKNFQLTCFFSEDQKAI